MRNSRHAYADGFCQALQDMCILNSAVTVHTKRSFSRLSPILKNSVRNSNNRYPVYLDSFKEIPFKNYLTPKGVVRLYSVENFAGCQFCCCFLLHIHFHTQFRISVNNSGLSLWYVFSTISNVSCWSHSENFFLSSKFSSSSYKCKSLLFCEKLHRKLHAFWHNNRQNPG